MVRLNRIYTRTGDDGTTGLVDGSRVRKDDARMIAIGEVDELNSVIGVAAAACQGDDMRLLRTIQNDLFDLGADLATPGNDFAPSDLALRIVPEQIAWLEQQIDRLNEALAPLDSFILPGGHRESAYIHLARAIARRAERAIVAAAQEVPLNPHVGTYLNRLSDLLFVLARATNDGGASDVKWVPGGNRQR